MHVNIVYPLAYVPFFLMDEALLSISPPVGVVLNTARYHKVPQDSHKVGKRYRKVDKRYRKVGTRYCKVDIWCHFVYFSVLGVH